MILQSASHLAIRMLGYGYAPSPRTFLCGFSRIELRSPGLHDKHFYLLSHHFGPVFSFFGPGSYVVEVGCKIIMHIGVWTCMLTLLPLGILGMHPHLNIITNKIKNNDFYPLGYGRN